MIVWSVGSGCVPSRTFHATTCSNMPMPMPAMKAMGRLVIAPMRAAVSARSRRSGPSTSMKPLPLPGAPIAVTAESNAASTHAKVDVRRTHTPARRAESAFSAIARMASPCGDRAKNSARARAQSGATISVSTSAPMKWCDERPCPMVKPEWNGSGYACAAVFGRMNGRSVTRNSTCVRPIVATMTSSRGRLNNRRNRSSQPAPITAATSSTKISAGQ